ncbi:hypothetical protein RI367_004412 [Sorochytrium milnesiophthora]
MSTSSLRAGRLGGSSSGSADDQSKSKAGSAVKANERALYQHLQKTAAKAPSPEELYRASLGQTASNLYGGDLDDYVTSLILQEAQAKRQKYNERGVEAYSRDEPKGPTLKPNTGFLSRVIRQTESHNAAQMRGSSNSPRRGHDRKERRERDLESEDDDDEEEEDKLRKRRRHEGDTRQPRGRGTAQGASRLDEVFAAGYDPSVDLSQFDILSNPLLDERIEAAAAAAASSRSRERKPKRDKKKDKKKKKDRDR